MRVVFERLRDHGIAQKFLGHHIDSRGIAPLQDKVQTVREFPQPTTQRKLRRFIGFVNFYHRFLPHCANLMQPLHDLLDSAKQTVIWTDTALAAFHAAKEALAKATLLSYPQRDAPTLLMTDASDTAVGAVLQQHIRGCWHPITFEATTFGDTIQHDTC